MVAQFLRLKLVLLANMFRRSAWQVVGIVLGGLYALFLALILAAGLIGARAIDDIELVRDVIVAGGSIVVVGFAVVPLVFGLDDTLDPRKFALFGIENKRLAGGLLIAALLGVPSLAMAIVAIGTIATWSRNPGAVVIAVICAAGILATCLLVGRVTTSIAAFLLASRRAREFSGIVGVLVLLIISPLVVLLANVDWWRDGKAVLTSIAFWLSWTPVGAVWAAPGDAATGDWVGALLKLLIALATIALLALAWQRLVARMLVTPHRESPAKAYVGLGWFGTMPDTPAGAIAARSTTYWTRDPRYSVSLVMIPVVPILMIVALAIAGVPSHYLTLLPLPVMCLFLGWTIHNDVAYDSTAIWLHVASGTRGAADRIGRLVPVILLGIPLIAIGTIVTVSIFGDWDQLPGIIGASSAILLVGVGLSSFSSALLPYPVTHPGDGPFTQPQASSSIAILVQSMSFVLTLLLAAPTIVFGVLGVFVDARWSMVTLLVGLGTGLVVLVGGILAGGAVFNRRGPELLAVAVRYD